MTTLFVQNLTVIDFSYLDAERGMLGESWIVDLELDGDLDAAGMVFDFGLVKKQIKQHLDNVLDHKLAVPTESPALNQLEITATVNLAWRYPAGVIEMQAPNCSTATIPAESITIASATPWLEERLKEVLPSNVQQARLHLRTEELGAASYYHYSHGLKKHDGNCQRIAHGHRSGISITVDGTKSSEWENEWAHRWHDIYIATREDLQRTVEILSKPHYSFHYEASQGTFSLTIPQSACYLIDTDTTVEYLAEHIANITAEETGKDVMVRAFEGVGKGAIAQAG